MTTSQTLPSGGPPLRTADGDPLPTEPAPPPRREEIQERADAEGVELPSYRAPTIGDDGVPSFDDEDGDENRRPRPFKLGGQTFFAAAQLPVRQLLRFMSLNDEWRTADLRDADHLLEELFRQVLLPESMERFSTGLGDLENPIPLTKIPRVIEWLVSEYGDRPTEASSPSSDDSESQATGTSSTDASQPAESTSATSPSTAS